MWIRSSNSAPAVNIEDGSTSPCWPSEMTSCNSKPHKKNAMNFFRISVLGMLLLCCGSAWAENYPTRAIRFVVPFVEGQATALSRLLAIKLTALLGVPVVLESRPGAGGATGTLSVIRSVGDGYTIVFGGTASLLQPFHLNPPYDAVKDLAPIAFLAVSAPPVVL